VKRDESNSLVRLADSVAGFVRDVLDNEGGETKKNKLSQFSSEITADNDASTRQF
jgi:hypothetical protein